MKRLYRVVGIFLVLITLSVFAGGCADELPTKKHSGGVPAGNSPAPKKKLVLWHIQQTKSRAAIIQDSIERFMRDFPDVEVESIPYLNDPYKVKLLVAMGTRNPPDVFFSWGGGPLREYIKADQILDITEMMEKDGYKNRFLDSALNTVTFDGRIWAVPVEGCEVALVFYNKKIFKDNDISVPKTYTQLLDIVKKLRSRRIIPFALANRTKWPGAMFYMYFVDRLGGPEVFKRAAGREGGSFEDEVFIKAGEMVQELVRLNAFPTGFNGLDYDTAQSRYLLYSGKAAMELMGTWTILNVREENNEYYEDNLDFFPFPSIEGGRGDDANLIGTMGDNFYSISTSCKYPEEAFKLIQYLIDDEAADKMAKIGKIAPLKNFKTDDPMLLRIISLIKQAPSIQLWYDQYLPLELGEKSKNTCKALFELSMSPREAAAEMEKAVKNYYKEAE